MSEEKVPYHTSTTPTTIARAAHACRERVFHVTGELNQLLADIRANEIDARTAQEQCQRLSTKLRTAADELDGPSAD